MLVFDKFKKSILVQKLFWISISMGLLLSVITALERFANADKIAKCEPKLITDLSSDEARLLQGEKDSRQVICYEVFIKEKQQLVVSSNVEIKLRSPDSKVVALQGKKAFEQPGEYLLTVGDTKNYQIKLDIKDTSKALASSRDRNLIAESKIKRRSADNRDKKQSRQLAYNQTKSPVYQQNKELQKIVDGVFATARQRGLNTNKLSISLIDLNTDSDGYAYASFQDDRARYPASIVKLFWLVALFGQYGKGHTSPRKSI